MCDVKATCAKVAVTAADNGVVAIAIAAVGVQFVGTPVLHGPVRLRLVCQGIKQVARLNLSFTVIAGRVALVGDGDRLAAVWAMQLNLGFNVIAYRAVQRSDLVIQPICNGGLEAAGVAWLWGMAALALGFQVGSKCFELGRQVFAVSLHRPICLGDLVMEVAEVPVPPDQQAM